MAKISDDEHEGEKTLEAQLLPALLGFGALIFFVICAFLSRGTESVWTSVLFALPVVAQIVGSVILWHRLNVNSTRGRIGYYRLNLYGSSACVFSYCFLWVLYSNVVTSKTGTVHPELFQYFSLLALAFVAFLLLLVALMTSAFVMISSEEPKGVLARQCKALRTGIVAEPLWAIALFFVLFLGVSFLFGFALAFHDQYALKLDAKAEVKNARPALRMANLKSIDDPKDENARNEKPSPTPSPEARYYFYYDDGNARLKTKTYSKCNPQSPPDRAEDNPRKPEEFNDCALRALVHRIAEDTKENKRIRVSLVGHTSDEPVGKGTSAQNYFSNYELSEARAQEVRFKVLKLFGDNNWRNVEWSLLPASSEALPEITRGLVSKDWFQKEELESRFKGKDAESLTQEDFERGFTADELFEKMTLRLDKQRLSRELRIVAASVRPVSDHVSTLQMTQIRETAHKSLTLMDYMYFSIYTITTTGYGDIVPTTSYAKFVTSLANICEVLFLVVFFNALISIKGDKQPDKTEEIFDLLKAQKNLNESEPDNSNVRKFGSREAE